MLFPQIQQISSTFMHLPGTSCLEKILKARSPLVSWHRSAYPLHSFFFALLAAALGSQGLRRGIASSEEGQEITHQLHVHSQLMHREEKERPGHSSSIYHPSICQFMVTC